MTTRIAPRIRLDPFAFPALSFFVPKHTIRSRDTRSFAGQPDFAGVLSNKNPDKVLHAGASGWSDSRVADHEAKSSAGRLQLVPTQAYPRGAGAPVTMLRRFAGRVPARGSLGERNWRTRRGRNPADAARYISAATGSSGSPTTTRWLA